MDNIYLGGRQFVRLFTLQSVCITSPSCLDQRLSGVNVATTAELGVNPDAKEAMCFALLAYQTLHRVPTSIPSVTGASGPALLGKICPVLQAD